ncbi:MAG TPA: efflux RND transporter periplasmic adaptor subunit [Thermoanaerobaculia bacterium]|nr:efflux RND transporter periplasmic adaptor subunit [Thermoanaerobaculia bacterium]
MEAQMEVPVERSFDWRRLRIPALAVALVIVLAVGGFFMFKSSGGEANAAAAASSNGNGKNGNGKEKAAVPVNVASVTAAPISSYISSTANLVADNEVKIVAEAEGRVERLLVEEGDYVRQGATLATLVRGDAEMLREKARVRAGNARIAFNRARDLNMKELMSQGDYEKIVMEKEVAEAELAEAQWRLSKTTIRAPFGGTVTERMISVGKHVRPGDALFTLTDFDPLIALIFLPERDVIALKEGHQVRMTLRAANDVVFNGRIRQISPVVDTATGTVKVTVEAVRPPEAVRPGAFVTVDIVRETKQNAVRIPREAVIRELREAHVFVVEGEVAKRRDLTLGIEEGDFIEALTGIKPGETVIVAGQGALRDGSVIKVLPAKG